MSSVVIDTSAVIAALAGGNAASRLRARLASADSLHAPHLLDIEVLHSLRGLVHGKKLSLDRAADVRADLAALPVTRYPANGLTDRIWELRGNLSAYDACFIALAETLRLPLVTCDERLGRASGHRAEVVTYPAHPN